MKSNSKVTFRFYDLQNTSALLKIIRIDNGVERELDSKMSIDILCKSQNGDFESFGVLTRTSFNTIEFPNLEPHTLYSCSGTVSVNGMDYEARGIDFLTKDGIPSQPRDVRKTLVTENQIQLTWKEPEFVRGVIEHYKVTVTRLAQRSFNDSLCKPLSSDKEKTFFVNDTNILIEYLSPSFSYTIVVRAETRHPETGQPSALFTTKTLNGPPAKLHIEKIRAKQRNIVSAAIF